MDMEPDLRTERTLRAMRSILATLAVLNDKLHDPGSIDDRVDLVLLSEDIMLAANELMLRAREIAWSDVGPFQDPDL